MRKMDKDGLILCDLQGKIFEESLKLTNTSSEIFIRRFMNSDVAKEFDSLAILDDTPTILDIFNELDNSYGKSEYGTFRYHQEVLFWIGYIYRYFSYTYEFSSQRVYGMLKPRWLKGSYYAYHTFDCEQAIERMLEERNINIDYENSSEKLLELIKEFAYENGLTLEDDAEPENEEHNISALYKKNIVSSIKLSKTESDKGAFEIKAKKNHRNNFEMEKTIISKLCFYAKETLGIRTLETKILKTDEEKQRLFEKGGFSFQRASGKNVILSRTF